MIIFFLQNKWLVSILGALLIIGGLITAPFKWAPDFLPRHSVAVDAIPNIGENQQIVFIEWPGHAPSDIEDQITYPLSGKLMGIPGVKSIRANSMFGFSSIYLIFEDDVDFYWSRARIQEKLASISPKELPENVQPVLGPDATALGQVFWYTLEGRDENGELTGGWDLHELREIQDFQVKHQLGAVKGVAEVASIGGFVQEYQVDIDPIAMKSHGVTIEQIMKGLKNSNGEVGASTIEMNRVEYMIRGLGYIQSVEEIEESLVAIRKNDIPIRIKDLAHVYLGPAQRRGALDKGGAEVVGGVITARQGANPMEVIENLKAHIDKIALSLPRKKLSNGQISQLTIVPFYDRSQLIEETLDTLQYALELQMLITILVIVLIMGHLRISLMVSALLPLVVLGCFIIMKYAGIEANLVALSGIAIAIGTVVDIGIILSENMLRYVSKDESKEVRLQGIIKALKEVGPAVITAIGTTIISFLPIFWMEGAEGKLFQPLAATKTIVLLVALFVAFIIMPTFAYVLLGVDVSHRQKSRISRFKQFLPFIKKMIIGVLAISLGLRWMPLGMQTGIFANLIFTSILLLFVIGSFKLLIRLYPYLLEWCLENKPTFLKGIGTLILLGVLSWLGIDALLGFLPQQLQQQAPYQWLQRQFPGIGKEFMPALDEGSFLLMPTSMVHAGMEENLEVLRQLDMAVMAIPEVDWVVGKMGRVESALDPAPISMYENIIHYKPEYSQDETGNLHRNWRPHIQSSKDIWEEIIQVTKLPGVTSAPKLQPIETRLVMLQTGMRAPMGIKVKGMNLDSIQIFGNRLAKALKGLPGIKPATVFADPIIAKPYLEIIPDRQAIARYGLSVVKVQEIIAIAIGGKTLGKTIQGRVSHAIRIRYARGLREDPSSLKNILVPTPQGAQIPLGQLAQIQYVKGPQMIRSEDAFLVGYVLFDKDVNQAEVDIVKAAQTHIESLIQEEVVKAPAGVSYTFSGNYQQQQRVEKKLMLIIPLVFLIIFSLIYAQFRSVAISGMVFSGILVAFSGGFILLWLFGQPWFGAWEIWGQPLSVIFSAKTTHLSVAVWVGFIALFGIATDDGVVIATYLQQIFAKKNPQDVQTIRTAVLDAATRRLKPCLMTTATTILALLPILSSSGRGADLMIPMTIPCIGGMLIEVITLFVIPVLYASWKEHNLTVSNE